MAIPFKIISKAKTEATGGPRATIIVSLRTMERTISTPATHSAHHGKHQSDGITNYKGNYGNLLFFWDVLFGTARITRKYPDEFGVENLEPVTAAQQLFWPLVQYKRQPDHADHS